MKNKIKIIKIKIKYKNINVTHWVYELKYNFTSFFLDLRKKFSSLYYISLFLLYIITSDLVIIYSSGGAGWGIIDTIIENLYFYQLFFPIVDDVPLSSEFVRS